jgi:hypothetical protein
MREGNTSDEQGCEAAGREQIVRELPEARDVFHANR